MVNLIVWKNTINLYILTKHLFIYRQYKLFNLQYIFFYYSYLLYIRYAIFIFFKHNKKTRAREIIDFSLPVPRYYKHKIIIYNNVNASTLFNACRNSSSYWWKRQREVSHPECTAIMSLYRDARQTYRYWR